jgi:UDP-N-acetylmuramyl pentapeptide phosphotransferase/UDP-N-acetylglucosamine-1-phosphate transferase
MPDTADAWSIVGTLGPIVWLCALLASGLLIVSLTPVFRNFAIATPTDRSSHTIPTPQWGGLAISASVLGVIATAALFSGVLGNEASSEVLLLALAAAGLVALGAADDHYSLGAASKLVVQGAAVAVMLAALPGDLRALPLLPVWLERGLLFLGAVWFVNVVNFMDGIDWMTVAEVVPVTTGVAVVGCLGALPPQALVVALALNGAMLGFAPFNRPVARLFMGDMGSLPVGLLLAWLLIVVGASGHPVAALLLPMYFVADTGITLVRRWQAGERLWVAHRTHFYQRARDNGFSNLEIVGRVFAVNCALVALAGLSVTAHSPVSKALALFAGVCLVAWLMLGFARGRA